MQKLPSKSSYLLPFSFVVEFVNNGFNLVGGGGGEGEKNSSTKHTKSSLLVPSMYIQAQQRLLWRGKTD